VQHIRSCGIDVGGTFTDLIYFDSVSGNLELKKVQSTPADQSVGVIKGINELKSGIDGFNIDILVHGSTVATNAILERKGVRTAFITTRGFQDIIEIGRQNRKELYSLFPARNDVPVERKLRFGVDERITANGDILKPLDPDSLEEIIQELIENDVRSVAVSLLFSFFNSVHEKIIDEKIKEKCPKMHVSLSSYILPEFREYERSMTTVLDAYIAPIMKKYFFTLLKRLRGISENPLILLSNGGVTQIRNAGHKSVETVLSGLAGGVLGGMASAIEYKTDAVTLDIGGTSTDVACIINGKNAVINNSTIGGLPLKIPVMDVQTVGAGGGSIARLKHGKLEVGPESAGADPGPACYGQNGKQPTVTDANLVLGLLNPEYFCGGSILLYPSLAKKVMEEFSTKAGFTTIEECASGIIEIFENNVSLALRRVSTERGYDPRELALIAFGGAGPLHACSLVDKLKMKEAIIPPFPGAWSAYGLLRADIKHDLSKSLLKPLSAVSDEEIHESFRKLEEKGLELCKEDGFPPSDVLLSRSLDIRLHGQSYELIVPYDGKISDSSDIFDREHHRVYGYSVPSEPRVIVNLRLTAMVLMPKFRIKPVQKGSRDPKSALSGNRNIFIRDSWYNAPVYRRSRLLAGNIIQGPAIIEQPDTTVFIDHDWSVIVDRSHIRLRRE